MKYTLLLLLILGLIFTSCSPAAEVLPVVTTPIPSPVVAPVIIPVAAPAPVLSDDERNFKAALSASPAYAVTYTYTYTSTSSNVRGTVAKYSDGSSKERVDTSISGVNTQMYIAGSDYTLCTKTGSTWSCSKSDAQAESKTLISQINNDVLSNIMSYDIERVSNEMIIGVDASCYHVVTAKDVSVDYCFNSDLVPLLIKTQKLQNGYPAIMELRATNHVASVPAERFVPPQVVTG